MASRKGDFVASTARSASLVLLGAVLGGLGVLEALTRSGGKLEPCVATFYRVRNVPMRVIRRDPQFVHFGKNPFYEHIDELVRGPPLCYHPPFNGQSNSFLPGVQVPDSAPAAALVPAPTVSPVQTQTGSDLEPVMHYFDPSYSDIYIAPPVPEPMGRPDEEGYEMIEHVYVSTSRKQPMYEEIEDFLPRAIFQKVADCLIGHPSIASNPLAEDTFSGTRGFASLFGGERGVARFLGESRFNCGDFNPLAAYFKAARDDHSTGFVMNVLVADKPEHPDSDVIVAKHVDNMLGIELPATEYFPRTVSVLYINVPDDMEGGQLEIIGLDGNKDEVIGSVTPVKNKLGRFRGDAYHQVRSYNTSGTDQRISLVFEQYRVLPEHQSRLIEYDAVVRNGMTMM